jgi:hypothetical protein
MEVYYLPDDTFCQTNKVNLFPSELPKPFIGVDSFKAFNDCAIDSLQKRCITFALAQIQVFYEGSAR